MNRQLELLIMLHDVDLLLKESQDVDTSRTMKKIGFKMAKQAEKIREARQKLIEELDKETVTRYERLMTRYERAVAPVLNGICYGCYQVMPTALATDKNRNKEIRLCPNCGRFLYWIEG
jgi:predicted  nucleic acid-binding Zn-ribbon protein